MFRLFEVSYDELKNSNPENLYKLRKKVFYDRLGWEVICQNDMEFDEYDKSGARYIIGVCNRKLICSVRFVMLDQPNMITHTFKKCFNDVELPAKGIESSRFFVDKHLSRQYLGFHYPVSDALFFAMINFSRHWDTNGIYTIISNAMLKIIERSGWKIRLIKEAQLSCNEKIYLVFLPSDEASQINMSKRLQGKLKVSCLSLLEWPMRLPINELT